VRFLVGIESLLCSQYSVLLCRSLAAPRLKYPKLQVKLKCNPYLGSAGKWCGAVQRRTSPHHHWWRGAVQVVHTTAPPP